MFRVVIAADLDKELERLRARSATGDRQAESILGLVERAIEKLARDYRCGKHIAKRLIPSAYVRDYGVVNLWKLNLDSSWRLIYTIRGDDVEVISVVLDILDHRDYDRKFGYRTS